MGILPAVNRDYFGAWSNVSAPWHHLVVRVRRHRAHSHFPANDYAPGHDYGYTWRKFFEELLPRYILPAAH